MTNAYAVKDIAKLLMALSIVMPILFPLGEGGGISYALLFERLEFSKEIIGAGARLDKIFLALSKTIVIVAEQLRMIATSPIP